MRLTYADYVLAACWDWLIHFVKWPVGIGLAVYAGAMALMLAGKTFKIIFQ